jgi:hypothetical protein
MCRKKKFGGKKDVAEFLKSTLHYPVSPKYSQIAFSKILMCGRGYEKG